MNQRIYETAAYRADSLDGCYWPETIADPYDYPPLTGQARTDVAIIGAGFAGLNAALELATAGARVTVLDLHRPGWGASGRNGGFCCLGSVLAGRDTLVRRYGKAELYRYHGVEKMAIAHVHTLLDRHGIDADVHSQAGEVQLAHRPRDFDVLRAKAEQIAQDYDTEARLIPRTRLSDEGMAGPAFHGGMMLPLGFALNPRKYVLGLADAAQNAGTRIHASSPVQSITAERGGGWRLTTRQGSLLTRQLLIATNGYSSDDVPDWIRARYLPVQSSIIVTRPLSTDEIAAQGWSTDLMAYDTRHLLHYFRLMPDRRFLFGMRGGISWTPATHAQIRNIITRNFHTMFPGWQNVEITHFWSGLANLTRNLVPFAGPVTTMPGAFAAFGWHGNGVAMASWTGQQVARQMQGQVHDLPAFFSHPPARFELGRFRRLSLRAAYMLYGLMDR